MRLLLVGCNAGGGGTESHFISLARALAASGHDVAAVVRPHDFIHRSLEREERIRLFPLEFRGRRDLRAVRSLTRLARTVRPDWIVGWFKAEYLALALAAKSAGVPLTLFSHLDQRIRPYMLNPVMGLVRAVIVPSEYLRGRYIERGLPPSRVIVLRNPVDLEMFTPDAALRARTRAALGLVASDVLLGYAGRFEPAKGVHTLAHAANSAMSRSANLHALWVGHGRSEQELRAITAGGEFAARHHWLPWLDDVRPAYAAMDMIALPSEGSETFGRVLIEAQACGIPVLGAENGGIPETLVQGDTGRLLPPGDIGSWTSAITDLVSDDRRLRFARNARSFAERFESHLVAADFVHILDSLSAASHTAPSTWTAPRPATTTTLAEDAGD
jgi:glycosyltransferase involved in cell wall biosynthesis